MTTYTSREFALELIKVASGPRLYKAACAEWALRWASEQGLAFDTTQEHLDALCSFILSCEAVNPSDPSLFTDATFGVWEPVALEVMRIGLFGITPPPPKTRSNTPPMRQFPRSSMPIQSSAADVGTHMHKTMRDLVLMDHSILQTHDYIEMPRKKLDEPLRQSLKAIMNDFQKAAKAEPTNLKWLTFADSK